MRPAEAETEAEIEAETEAENEIGCLSNPKSKDPPPETNLTMKIRKTNRKRTPGVLGRRESRLLLQKRGGKIPIISYRVKIGVGIKYMQIIVSVTVLCAFTVIMKLIGLFKRTVIYYFP